MSEKNKYLYKFIVLLLIIICISVFSFYKINLKPDGKKVVNRVKVGLSMDSLVVERWQTDRDIFMAKVKELGGEVIVQDAGNDSNEQINQIKYLIGQDINVLVILPNDSDALAPVVAVAKKKGIKVICYDRIIRKGGADLYITFDNERVGELMGEAISKKFLKETILL